MVSNAKHTSPDSGDTVPVERAELLKGISLKFSCYEERFSDNGAFWVFVGTDEAGQSRSVALFHTAAKSRVRRVKPQPGEEIYFRMGGETKRSGNGRDYVPWLVKAVGRAPITELPGSDEDAIDEGLQLPDAEPPPQDEESF